MSEGDGSAVAALRDAVDGLLDTELTALAGAQVAELLVSVEAERRRLAALDHRLLAELVERGVAGEYGATSPAALLMQLLRVAPGEARSRLAQARELGPRRELSGEPLEPVLPVVASAVREGTISSAHVSVISACLVRIPNRISAQATPVAEQFMVDAARHEHPKALARTGELLLIRLDPDGLAPHEDEAERRRTFDLCPRADGSAKGRSELTAEANAVWQTILDALAAPVSGDDPDTRSAGQRRHDAFLDAGLRLLRSGNLPAAGGIPLTVLVTTDLDDLLGQSSPHVDEAAAGSASRGFATTAHGAVWSMRQLILSACEAAIVPVVFNEAGGILAYGRTRRLASPGQRLALVARDRGCSFPRCETPAAWCEVHHVIEWLDGGRTDIDNLCLLCRYHHRHFAQLGWQVRMTRDGRPEWLPPPWLDPDRTARRNTAHHPHDYPFATPDPVRVPAGAT